MESDGKFSLHVSRALDCLGKGHEMVKFRVERYKEHERHLNSELSRTSNNIIAGSKGEGLTAPYENDYDIMHVTNNVICVDNTAHFRNFNGFTVFEADRRNTSPGYTILRLENWGGLLNRDFIQQSLFEDSNGQLYFSSDFYFESLTQNKQINTYRSGPSQTMLVTNGSVYQDYVHAFHYSCPEIIHSFIRRPRDHEWPTYDQLAEISNLEGHVVPVGYKRSPTAFLEWRICYTKAERFLMRCLNDTHTKTYILLKMISKEYIKFVCKDITSYVLKNIIFWQAECCYLETFKEELLVERLTHALVFLRKCVMNNSLPSYMIPTRNLFSGIIDISQRQKLVSLLTKLIQNVGGLLMGCERLRGTMIVLYMEPALAEQYRCKRDFMEKVFLRQFNIFHDTKASGNTYEAFNNLLRTLYHILLPDHLSLMLQGHDLLSLASVFKTREMHWLS